MTFERTDKNQAVASLATNMHAVNQLYQIATAAGYNISDTSAFTLEKGAVSVTLACFDTRIEVTRYEESKVSGITFDRTNMHDVGERFRSFIRC